MDTLVQINTTVAQAVWSASAKAALLIVLVVVVQRLFSRSLTVTGRYWLWVAVVLSLLVPVGVGVGIPLPTLWEPAVPLAAPMPGQNERAASDALLAVQPAAAEMHAANTALEWRDWLALAWLSGVATLLVAVAVRQWRFTRVVRAAQPAAKALQQQVDACRRLAGCKRRVQLRVSAHIDAPLVTGLWQPTLLLPAGLDTALNADQLQHVFLHELVHVRRGDIATNWLLTLLQTLHWCNPLVWLAFGRLRQERELVCDAYTLRLLDADARQAYGYTLLQLSDTRSRSLDHTLAIGIVDDKDQLQRRIAMIMQHPTPSPVRTALTGLLLLTVATLAFGKPMPEVAEAPQRAADADETVRAMQPAPAPRSEVAQAVRAPVTVAAASAAITTPAVAPAKPAAPRVAAQTATAATVAATPAPLQLALADTTVTGASAAPASLALPLPKAAAVQEPEVIVIVGRSLREKMLSAERNAYAVFNKYIDNPQYRITCSLYIPTGTHLERQDCKPGFEREAEQEHALGYLQNMQGTGETASSPTLRQPLEAVFARHMPVYHGKLKEVAQQHPDFLAAIKRYSDLKKEYLSQTDPVGN